METEGAWPVSRVTLAAPARNRLAALIVDSLRDPAARRALEALAGADPTSLAQAANLKGVFPRDWFDAGDGGLGVPPRWAPHAAELAERARRAWRALGAQPVHAPAISLGDALVAAGLLFDAGLYFEAHELLEPYWRGAAGSDREALQGLIQIAVGLQHLADGNAAGARSLLRAGADRLSARELGTIALDPFARGVVCCLEDVQRLGAAAPSAFDWSAVPRFPARST